MTVPRPSTNRKAIADERTPLLLAAESEQPLKYDGQSSHPNGSDVLDDGAPELEDKPLDKGQIFLLCFSRIVEPVAFFCIFPFIPQMIQRTGIPESDIGFYSGLIESLFSVTQTVLMLGWGRASDRFGRKPVLVFSLAGISVCTALFGFSKTLWQMILFRCMAGLFGGSLVTVRTMISENSTPATQARAFSYFAFSGNLGIFLGPTIGGLLADPAKTMPATFGRIALFREFPYALPTLMTGIIAITIAILDAIWLNETLDRKAISDGRVEGPVSVKDLLKSDGVPIVLYLYSHVMMMGNAFTAVTPVFYYTSIELGGWNLSPQWISIIMAVIGLSQAAWLLLAFPPLQRRFGTAGVLVGCATLWPICFVIFPLYNFFLRIGWNTFFWSTILPMEAMIVGVAMAFTAVQLALNEISPSPMTLGTLNALALTLSCAVRGFAPGLFTSLFAIGVRSQFLNGYLIWIILFANGLMIRFAVRWLPDRISTGKQRRNIRR